MMKRIICILWGLLVFLLPLQTVFIISQKEIGSPSGVWQYGTIAVYATDIVAFVLLLIWGVWMIRQRLWMEYGKMRVVMCLLLLFFLIVGVGVWRSLDIAVSVQAWLRLLMGVFLFLSVYTLRSSNLLRRVVAYSWLGGAVLQSFAGWYQFVTGGVYASKWLGVSSHSVIVLGDVVVENVFGRWLRAYGTMPHPNILGVFLSVGLLMGAVLFFTAKKTWERILILTGSSVVAIGLLLSFSRSAWVGCIIGFILLIALLSGKKIINLRLFAVFICSMLAVCVLVISNLPLLFLSRIGAGGWERLESRSISERVYSLKEAREDFFKRPLLGSGIGVSTLARYYDDTNHGIELPYYAYQPVHNLYALIVVELGLVGAIIFFAWMWFIARDVFFLRIKNVGVWSAGAVTMVGMFLSVSFFDHFFWTTHVGVLMWWIGLSVILIFNEWE